jgi:predicted nucleic acid-binding protein
VLVTTDYVLDEAYTLLLLNICYRGTVAFHKKIEQMADLGILNIVRISKTLADETWKIFEQFNVDKEWSFTNCSSYVVMKQLEIDEAFVFDHHFEQMRFVKRP